MKTIFVFSEENHGEICYASTFDKGVEWLMKENWIDENSEVYISKKGWTALHDIFGDLWADEIRFMSMERFKDFFDGCFYVKERELV